MALIIESYEAKLTKSSSVLLKVQQDGKEDYKKSCGEFHKELNEKLSQLLDAIPSVLKSSKRTALEDNSDSSTEIQ